ncbi:MAG: ABC transporter permease [Oscillospiraceae bacterium]|nr:ABC transporter permease [Oscillospiraceae bacterium]
MQRSSVLFLSVLRQIRSTLGRYLAIFAIIALGVGFFAGLRVSTDAMLKTANEYLREKSLYDFRLISTLGLTGEDVEAFAGLNGVETAVGSVSADFLCAGEEGDTVFRAHMITDGVNRLELVAGRLPEAGDECVLDAKYFGEESIGLLLPLSDDNTEDTRDFFAYDAYRVVGLVDAPYYVNFERGTTALGRGTLAGFIYIPADGFDTELYTEVFLSLGDRGDIYSDEYEAAVDGAEPAVSALLEERASIRHDSLEAEALEKIADAQSELDEGRETYETERAEAEKELSDALEELNSARKELDDGWQQLSDGKEELNSRRSDAETRFADARRELDNGWAELENGKQELAAQRETAEQGFADARAELEEAAEQLAAARSELDARRADSELQLRYAQVELEGAARQLAQGEAQLAQCRSLYDAGVALTQAVNAAGLGVSFESPSALIAALSSGENALLNAAAEQALGAYGMTAESFCAAWDQAEQQLGTPLSGETIAALAAGLDDARTKYNEGSAQFDEAKRTAEAAFAEAEAQLAASREQYDAGAAELEKQTEAAETAFAEAEDQLSASEAQLAAGESEYAEGRRAANEAIAEAERELADSERKLGDGEAEYADGLREYEDARAEADAQFADAERELADGQRELDEAREKLSELEEPSTYVLDRTANIGCATLDNDMGIVRGVSRVFPLFFFLVAALVCVTTMTRMVDEQRTQNGVLKALGYGSGAIIGQYLFYSGSASVLGCIVGFLLGSRFLPLALWQVYRIMYSIARPVAFLLDWKLFADCTALFLLCSMGATYLVCRRDLNESPAELIRPKSPPAGRRILIERAKFIWKRVKFLHKVSIRNILRYKKRMIMMILGVGGCTALLLTGFGIRDSIQHILDYQFDEIEVYDCSVSFTKALSETETEAFRAAHQDEVSGAAFLHVSAMDLTAGGKTLSVNAVVFEEEMDGFIDLHRGEDHIPWPETGETVIDYRLAMDCGLKKGDVITLRDTELREVTLTVTGIFDNYIYDYAFIRADTFRDQWGTAPEVKTAYLNLAEGADQHAAAAAIMGDDNVAAVNVLSDMRERVASMLSSLNYIVLIVLVCAGALAFIVLYNLTNISINERRREIATLKVLGFYPNESAAYVFRENMVLTGVSALVGLPMGYALLWYVMRQIKISSFYFGCRAAPLSYVISVALTFVFAAAVAFLLNFKLDRIDMADSLKAIE